MEKLFWVLTIIGCIIGGCFLAFGLNSATGAPQEAAVAAIAISFAVIPYCMARAVSSWNSRKIMEEIADALQAMDSSHSSDTPAPSDLPLPVLKES